MESVHPNWNQTYFARLQENRQRLFSLGSDYSVKEICKGWIVGKIDSPLNKKLKGVRWGEYKLKDLFDIVGTKSLDKNANSFIKDGINFVGRTFENNGIQGKIEEQTFEPNKPFTITATVIGNYKYVKYQTEPYYCSQNINKLTPKTIISNWDKNVAYYYRALL